MSTLKVNKIEQTGTTDGGIQLDSDGHVQIDGIQLPTSGALSNRNLIINGNFAINQRGGSNTTINTYALDRWRSYGGALGFTISQQDVLSSLSTSKYAIRFQRTAGDTQTNNTGICQGIESKNCEGLAGTKLTLSFKVRAGSDISGDFAYNFFFGEGTDENPVGMTNQTSSVSSVSQGTDWTTLTKTVTVPSGTTQITVGFSYTPTGTAGSDDWFEVAEVQVERGDKATPFEHRSYGDELQRCLRYFFKPDCEGSAKQPMMGMSYGSNSYYIPWQFPVPMRVGPSVPTEGGADWRSRRGNTNSFDVTWGTHGTSTTTSVTLYTSGGTISSALPFWFETDSSSGCSLEFRAEL